MPMGLYTDAFKILCSQSLVTKPSKNQRGRHASFLQTQYFAFERKAGQKVVLYKCV